MLSKPASMSTTWLPNQYLGNTVLKCTLCKNHHRSNNSSLTIYVIVFCAGFSPALEVQKSVMILHFTSFLTNHNKTWTRYIYLWCSKMTGVRFVVKSIVA